VPDALPLADDLVALQRLRVAAETALGEYISTVETRRREQYPDPCRRSRNSALALIL
jgi:hypothetical protein